MDDLDRGASSITCAGADDLRHHAPAWRALWQRLDGSPFLAPEWVLAWADNYAPGRTYAALLWQGEALAGMLPVFVWEQALLLAGTGPSDDGGILIEPGAAARVPDLIEAAAGAVREPFSRIRFEALAPEDALCEASLRGWRAWTEPGRPRAVLALFGAEGMDQVPPAMRRGWQASLRRIGREGGRIERAGAGEGAADLLRLHAARWARKGEPGMLSDPLLRRLVSAALPDLVQQGIARSLRLVMGAEAIATLAVFASGRGTRHSYYLGGFDPHWSRFSPGMVLIGAAIREAANCGALSFDFLRGAEDYKLRWGARVQTDVMRVLERAPSV